MRTIEHITGNLVDVHQRRTYPAVLHIDRGSIVRIEPTQDKYRNYLAPGLVDAHIHVESSMLSPTQYALAAVRHGTIASVSDPHEIANVLGMGGIELMLNDGQRHPLKFNFGAPSCVPATEFETAGAALDADTVQRLLDDPRINYLSEMMNWPGVLGGDAQCLAKIHAAHQRNMPVDGHAPGLTGDQAHDYIAAGIHTDHECFTYDEAIDKIEAGAKIIIREGSAARNFEALHPLLESHPQRCMFGSDDRHPDDLIDKQMDDLIRRALAHGHDLYDIWRAASVNAVEHYGLPMGLLREGDSADFVEFEDLRQPRILRTWIDGQCVSGGDRPEMQLTPCEQENVCRARPIRAEDIAVKYPGGRLRAIRAIDGELITRTQWIENPPTQGGHVVTRAKDDLLKLVVVNRYQPARPAVAFIQGFGLDHGALASSVAHDSHNIIAVGVEDAAICRAVEAVIHDGGGLAIADADRAEALPLPIAGLMSPKPIERVAELYQKLDRKAKTLGCTLRAPYMTLSFMALLVIPELKLSDKGLFDGRRFEFVAMFD